jgi:hypothetical protein
MVASPVYEGWVKQKPDYVTARARLMPLFFVVVVLRINEYCFHKGCPSRESQRGEIPVTRLPIMGNASLSKSISLVRGSQAGHKLEKIEPRKFSSRVLQNLI